MNEWSFDCFCRVWIRNQWSCTMSCPECNNTTNSDEYGVSLMTSWLAQLSIKNQIYNVVCKVWLWVLDMMLMIVWLTLQLNPKDYINSVRCEVWLCVLDIMFVLWFYLWFYIQGVGQGHMYHKALLITIILNVVLLPFDNDILYMDDCIQLLYSHFHYRQGNGGYPMQRYKFISPQWCFS